eukprot:5983055-Prymnesium_polylepis.1
MLGTWEVSPHQETAARHRSKRARHAWEQSAQAAGPRGCGQEARRKSAQRHACGRQYDGDPGAVAASASTDSPSSNARERVGRQQIGAQSRSDSATRERMHRPRRASDTRSARRRLGWEGVAAAPSTACCAHLLTCARACPLAGRDVRGRGGQRRRAAARQDPQDCQRAGADPQQGGHRFQAPQVHLCRAAGRRDR